MNRLRTTVDELTRPRRFEEMLGILSDIIRNHERLPATESPLDALAREFFINNYEVCRDGLLSRTRKIRVTPTTHPVPHAFSFVMDIPYKRKIGSDSQVELHPGPLRGEVLYRPDLFETLDQPSIAVLVDRDQHYFHPNYSREIGAVCLGDLPGGPFPLDSLLSDHLYPILTYQNRRPSHPADLEAARFFALDPRAMEGLEPVEPLY